MRDKFDAYQIRATRLEFLHDYRDALRRFPVTDAGALGLPQPCRDPQDDKFLALARHCKADIIVSSDSDLLVLNPWQGVPILTPAQFLG
jgi:uncharacterized protein